MSSVRVPDIMVELPAAEINLNFISVKDLCDAISKGLIVIGLTPTGNIGCCYCDTYKTAPERQFVRDLFCLSGLYAVNFRSQCVIQVASCSSPSQNMPNIKTGKPALAIHFLWICRVITLTGYGSKLGFVFHSP